MVRLFFKGRRWLLFIIFILFSLSAFTQTYNWTGAVDNGADVTQTVNGVLAKVSSPTGEIKLFDGSGHGGSNGEIVFESGNGSTSMSIIFNSAVNIESIYAFNADTGGGETWIFTPTGGSNSVVNKTIDTGLGETVSLGWTNVTEITITNTISVLVSYGIDDIVLADVTPPTFENSTPVSSLIAQTSFTLETDIDEAGTIYYVAVVDGATAPTSSEVVAGTGNGGAGEVASGNAVVSTGGFTNDFNVTGLTSGTAYDVYVVAQDDEATPNLQTSPTKIDVTLELDPIPTVKIELQTSGSNIDVILTSVNVDFNTDIWNSLSFTLKSPTASGVVFGTANQPDNYSLFGGALTGNSYQASGFAPQLQSTTNNGGQTYTNYTFVSMNVMSANYLLGGFPTGVGSNLPSNTGVTILSIPVTSGDISDVVLAVEDAYTIAQGISYKILIGGIDRTIPIVEGASTVPCSFDANESAAITDVNFPSTSVAFSASPGLGNSWMSCADGNLDKISIFAINAGETITIGVYSGGGNGGALLGTATATSTVATSIDDRNIVFDFSSLGISLTEDATYTWAVTSDSLYTRLTNTSIYENGSAYDGVTISEINDFMFMVDVIEAVVDVIPPVFENSKPDSSSVTQVGFTLETDIDEAGTIYYIVVADGATAPTSAEVVAGTGSGGTGQVTSGNAIVNSGDFTNDFSVTGLTTSTAYDVYVVAQDDEGTPNLQINPTKIDVLTQSERLVAVAVVDSSITCYGNTDGAATASASGGTMPYTYLWSNGSTTASISGVVAGIYNVYITDNNGVKDTTDVTITEPSLLSGAVVIDSNVMCNGSSDGGASASATGGTAPYTYLWSNGATSEFISGVSSGVYSVTITDANGCTTMSNGTITQPHSLVAIVGGDSVVTCNGGSDGGATAFGLGGTAPYTYLWSNGATTASISGVPAGLYTVYVTDYNECLDSALIAITQPGIFSTHAYVDSSITCNGSSDGGASVLVYNGMAPFTYLWSNGATTSSISGVAAGEYSVTVTDTNGCTTMGNVTVTEPSLLSGAVVIDSNVTCNGSSDGGASASATGGTAPYTYLWSNGSTSAFISGVSSGVYSVTITDANGCTSMSNGTITQPHSLVAIVGGDSVVTCNGGSDGGATAFGLGGTAPYTYLWSNGATTASISGVSAGLYTVYVTDYNECLDSALIAITQPGIFSAHAYVNSSITCNGSSDGGATVLVYNGMAPFTYLWSNGATTSSISGVSAGEYSVTITDTNGCTTMGNVTVTEPVLLVASAVVNLNVLCNGDSTGKATASATGGNGIYDYLWSNGATTAIITGVPAGTYTATITDANGCYDTTSVTITEPTVLIATSVVDSNITCHGLSDGGATSSITGGIAPYTYVWSNGATTASITGVVAGTYTATITDANGCYDTTSVTVTEPAASESTDTVKATDSFEWMDGVTYTESIYGPTHILTNVNGCDSTITLDLTIINYCTSRSTRNRYEWIKHVELEDDIDNLSNANSGGYGDYTDQILTVDTGDLVSVALTPGYKRRVYDEYWRIWADWNYDGDFDDAGEKVFEQKGKNVRTGSFTIPVDVDAHDLGLRVSMRWKSYAASCSNFSNGEVEDYTIHVNGAQGYNNLLPIRMAQEDYVDVSGGLYEFTDLYPNPVQQGDYVYGFIRVEETGIKQLQIVNTLGQIIKSESIICDEEENRFEVSTEGLAKGFYFINIDSGLETIKIIVQ